MDFPIRNGGSFHGYLKLPEGINLSTPGTSFQAAEGRGRHRNVRLAAEVACEARRAAEQVPTAQQGQLMEDEAVHRFLTRSGVEISWDKL